MSVARLREGYVNNCRVAYELNLDKAFGQNIKKYFGKYMLRSPGVGVLNLVKKGMSMFSA